MFKNLKLQSFADDYFKIADDDAAKDVLKDFMFSLSPDEFCEFMIETGRSHNEAVLQRLADPTCTEEERQMYREQIDNIVALLTLSPLSKAA
jgi:hypothetical protein